MPLNHEQELVGLCVAQIAADVGRSAYLLRVRRTLAEAMLERRAATLAAFDRNALAS